MGTAWYLSVKSDLSDSQYCFTKCILRRHALQVCAVKIHLQSDPQIIYTSTLKFRPFCPSFMARSYNKPSVKEQRLNKIGKLDYCDARVFLSAIHILRVSVDSR